MMPLQSIWMMKISLMWLLISIFIGGLILIEKAAGVLPAVWGLLSVHYELAIWGWMVQFIIGTAYWMFPKFLTGTRRGPEWAAWSVVVLLNAGVISLISSVLPQFGYLPKLGRGLILLSILAFVTLTWKRVVTYRNHSH
ncbi:hypothetical protein [Rhodohalobacter halophilus]|uniref:hypothetical protein n=1 Tax=Rhodohalobacter halophilus TaxID=1812810 RepID=UPI00083F5D43|nr:hypothetical protein [Rhodohalobacter halophilus]